MVYKETMKSNILASSKLGEDVKGMFIERQRMGK
jgi:hypothetical protein